MNAELLKTAAGYEIARGESKLSLSFRDLQRIREQIAVELLPPSVRAEAMSLAQSGRKSDSVRVLVQKGGIAVPDAHRIIDEGMAALLPVAKIEMRKRYEHRNTPDLHRPVHLQVWRHGVGKGLVGSVWELMGKKECRNRAAAIARAKGLKGSLWFTAEQEGKFSFHRRFKVD